MNKVTIINLNGKAYQLEESGYALLKNYLDEAEQKLASNPDKTEIIKDFEQAVAEKADKRLNFQKTVITEAEIIEIISEMGPVEGEEPTNTGARSEERDANLKAKESSASKRFYRIREGKIIGGVCTGLSAYFNVDVAIIRLIVILFALVTNGFMFIAYIVAMIIVPMADTDEKLSAAYGIPFNAQELMSRAKSEYGSARQSWKSWRKDRKRQWRENIRRERIESYPSYHSVGSKILQVLLGLISASITITWILGLITLFAMGGIFGIVWTGMPIWIVAILFTILYGIIVSPFSADSYSYCYDYGNQHYCQNKKCGNGTFSILFIILFFWLIYHFVPESHPVFMQVGDALRQAWEAVKLAFEK